jgi:hypothetical protein
MMVLILVGALLALVVIGIFAPARARRAREQAGRQHVDMLRAMGAEPPKADTRKWSKADKARLSAKPDLAIKLDN